MRLDTAHTTRFSLFDGSAILISIVWMSSGAFAQNLFGTSSKSTLELTHSLAGHIPRAVRKMTDRGKILDIQTLPVTIALQLNHEQELDQEIEEMYRPGNPRFHRFLTPETFAAKYAPTLVQVAAEKNFLESQGISVQDVSENHCLIHALGTVSQLNAAFQTELHKFTGQNGNEYFAPAYELQTPINSRIAAVVGLSNTAQFHTHMRKRPKPRPTSGPEGSAPGGGISPKDIRTAYNIPSNLDGSGQTLALFELDGYEPSNIATYEKQFGLPSTQLTNILVSGFDGKPVQQKGAASAEAEVELDIELMIALAPKAQEILIYEAPNSAAGVIDAYTRIASDNRARQISSSWGKPEDQSSPADMQSENTILKQMVAQGQTLFASAGDNGSEDDGATVSTDDPSGQPYVVSVGGTKLLIDSNSNWQSESTWNELSLAHPEGAGGGGVSTQWSIPSWQVGAASSDPQFSTKMRNLPDVSLNADPETGYSVFVADPSSNTMKPAWVPMGGTSAAAPLWAAFNALVNQNRAAKGLSPTGFLNPALYLIGMSPNRSSDFHDIADGSTNGVTDGFKTSVGYDNSTGWGSFNGANLLSDLSK